MLDHLPNTAVCDTIVDTVLGKRIPLEDDTPEEIYDLRNIIKGKINYFVTRDLPIEFSISAFSLKSQIPGKCISSFPDFAEYEALLSFSNLIGKIEKMYSHGAKVNIFADGRLFVGLLYGFTDERVTLYIQKLKDLAQSINTKSIKILSLEDVFGNNFENARKLLFSDNYVNTENMIAEMQKTEYSKKLLIFIRDFYAKDIRSPFGLSLSQSKVEGLKMGIGVLSASKSWGKVIKEITDKNCIRLSCHSRPYIYEPGKVGIYMNNIGVKCCMPWHGVALNTIEGIVFKRKEEAIRIGATLVENNGLPYYTL